MATTSKNSDDPIAAIERDTEELKRTVNKESGAAAEAWHDAQDAARQKASEMAAEARAGAYRQAENAQREASSSLHTFASVVRTAGDQLAEHEQGLAARFVREAANGLEQLSNTLARKRVEEIVDDVRDFGRHNPTAFIAGSVLAGIALGRFVRSTASDSGPSHSRMRPPAGEPSGNGTGHVEIGARPGASSRTAPKASPSSEPTSGRNQ